MGPEGAENSVVPSSGPWRSAWLRPSGAPGSTGHPSPWCPQTESWGLPACPLPVGSGLARGKGSAWGRQAVGSHRHSAESSARRGGAAE